METARAFSERGLSISPSDARLLGTRLVIEFETGNTLEGHRFLEQAADAHRSLMQNLVMLRARYDHASVALMIPIAARITAGTEHLHLAEAAAETIFAAGSATPLVTRFDRIGLGLTAILEGDKAAAEDQYAAPVRDLKLFFEDLQRSSPRSPSPDDHESGPGDGPF